MLILDDLLLSPFKGIMWVFRKIDQSAREELESQGERLKKELSDLYMELETGHITDEQFDAREKQLLDQLDKLKKAKAEEAARFAGQAKGPEEGG